MTCQIELNSTVGIVHVLWLLQDIENDVREGKGVRKRKRFIQIASLMVLVRA